MEISSPRFKAFAVSMGFSLWFFIISSALAIFSFEVFLIFIAVILIVTQIFSVKLSKGLDVVSVINTKIFLGIIFVLVISLYGILFRTLRIDLLRLQRNHGDTYWLEMEKLKERRIFKQY